MAGDPTDEERMADPMYKHRTFSGGAPYAHSTHTCSPLNAGYTDNLMEGFPKPWPDLQAEVDAWDELSDEALTNVEDGFMHDPITWADLIRVTLIYALAVGAIGGIGLLVMWVRER